MLESGTFPNDQKLLKYFVYIKKRNINYITTYRPIPLLPFLSRVSERFIFNQFYTYLDHNNLLSEQQHRIRANQSAELAPIKFDYIVHEIDRI